MKALVATRTRILLDRRLCRPAYNSHDLRSARKRSKGIDSLTFELHTVIKGLILTINHNGVEFFHVRSGVYGTGRRIDLSELAELCKEHATFSAVSEIKFDSWIPHQCESLVFHDGSINPSELRDSCIDVYAAQAADGGAVTVDQFLRTFRSTLMRICMDYAERDLDLDACMLRGWKRQRVDLKTATVCAKTRDSRL